MISRSIVLIHFIWRGRLSEPNYVASSATTKFVDSRTTVQAVSRTQPMFGTAVSADRAGVDRVGSKFTVVDFRLDSLHRSRHAHKNSPSALNKRARVLGSLLVAQHSPKGQPRADSREEPFDHEVEARIELNGFREGITRIGILAPY